MEACDDKEVRPITNDAAAFKRAYVKPELVEFGDVRELTRQGGGGSPDFRGTPRR